eukprot:CAMPEP_0172200368 /NCGR_PEP_ID=MMETSP1050-20130122/29284_1 /TAXON_ID=233186 /ORGANISM="Cryptomonas curvata, Strain CCAP979/52" /LENGTH=122 /DNA_ID=CAMNT_0012877653 /DNA_START=26 /DNA_END=390 /DNA_ORIENTATION=-
MAARNINTAPNSYTNPGSQPPNAHLNNTRSSISSPASNPMNTNPNNNYQRFQPLTPQQVVQPPPIGRVVRFQVQIPPGVFPGMQFKVQISETLAPMVVTCPAGMCPGKMVLINITMPEPIAA